MQEIRRRGLKVAVAGIPKTIDNDIPVLLKPCSTSEIWNTHISIFWWKTLIWDWKCLMLNIVLFLVQVIDKSFGFDTAVEEAQRAISAGHIESESFENGIGLVKLMGRYSGMLHSSTSNFNRTKKWHRKNCWVQLEPVLHVPVKMSLHVKGS